MGPGALRTSLPATPRRSGTEGGLAGTGEDRCRVFAGEEERRRQLPDYDSSDSEEDELAVEPQDEGIERIWHDFNTHKIAAAQRN